MNLYDRLFRLDGRIALITGAGGYLGSGIARGMAAKGAEVVLWDYNPEAAGLLAEQIKREGGAASATAVNVMDEAVLQSALNDFKLKHQKVDVIINGAYTGGGGSSEHASAQDFSKAYQIAVTAAFQITQGLRSLLRNAAAKNAGGSSVINIASMYGMVSPDIRVYESSAGANPPFYGAAKAGLIQLTRYMACEFACEKIRVNSISPGPFPNKKVQADNPGFCDRLAEKVPMGRIGRPEELIGPALFLASDAASYVTGANLTVDGGWTAW
jgi:NAD(P)-dependent dehydrogenase (short-subunit alcohol dehydrogenase family)